MFILKMSYTHTHIYIYCNLNFSFVRLVKLLCYIIANVRLSSESEVDFELKTGALNCYDICILCLYDTMKYRTRVKVVPALYCKYITI